MSELLTQHCVTNSVLCHYSTIDVQYLLCAFSRSPKPVLSVVDDGIFINVIKAQRLNKTWSNPLVIKLENVEYRDKKKGSY